MNAPGPDPQRELYVSANSDRWSLVYSREWQRPVVRHVPNAASGGAPSDIEVADFLKREGNPPEKEALIRLIGCLIGGEAPSGADLEVRFS